MRLVIVSNVAAPYRTELFHSVQLQIPDTSVFFQAIEEPNRSWPIRPVLPYPHSYLSGIRFPIGWGRGLLFHPELGHRLRARAPDVVVAYGFGTTTVQCARYAMANGSALLIANDGTDETDPCKGAEALYRRELVARASGFIAASSRAAEYFRTLGAEPSRITVVNLTRDLHYTRARADEIRETLHRTPGQFTVCVAARLVRDKRILDACKAVLRLAEEFAEVRLRVAGEGPLRNELEAWVTEHGQGRIELVGLLEWDELLRLYASSDVMLFPATGEKYGMVMIEALACGLPVVAYDNAGAARELVRDDVTGYLVPDGDWAQLSSRLGQLLGDRGRHQQMSAAARGIVDTHDITVQSKRFVQAVRSANSRSGVPV